MKYFERYWWITIEVENWLIAEVRRDHKVFDFEKATVQFRLVNKLIPRFFNAGFWDEVIDHEQLLATISRSKCIKITPEEIMQVHTELDFEMSFDDWIGKIKGLKT